MITDNHYFLPLNINHYQQQFGIQSMARSRTTGVCHFHYLKLLKRSAFWTNCSMSFTVSMTFTPVRFLPRQSWRRSCLQGGDLKYALIALKWIPSLYSNMHDHHWFIFYPMVVWEILRIQNLKKPTIKHPKHSKSCPGTMCGRSNKGRQNVAIFRTTPVLFGVKGRGILHRYILRAEWQKYFVVVKYIWMMKTNIDMFNTFLFVGISQHVVAQLHGSRCWDSGNGPRFARHDQHLPIVHDPCHVGSTSSTWNQGMGCLAWHGLEWKIFEAYGTSLAVKNCHHTG